MAFLAVIVTSVGSKDGPVDNMSMAVTTRPQLFPNLVIYIFLIE